MIKKKRNFIKPLLYPCNTETLQKLILYLETHRA